MTTDLESPDAADPPKPIPEVTQALFSVLKALEGLAQDDIARIMDWVSDKYQLSVARRIMSSNSDVDGDNEANDSEKQGEPDPNAEAFATFDKLYEVLAPETDVDKALAAAYWLGKDCTATFTGKQIQDCLKPHGHELTNVTTSLSGLGTRKPKLVIQVGKGEGKMGKKKYRLTTEGRKEVIRLITKTGGDE
jgi:hypothetical protein